MLAATSDPVSRLGLLSVILRSINEQAAERISTSLKERAFLIIHAAAEISANPAAISADTSPEAIELAFKLRSNPALSKQLSQLNAFDAIRPEIAQDVLKALQPSAA